MTSQRILAAFRLATVAHDGQRRKYRDLPYVLHPIEVANEVHRWWGSQLEWQWTPVENCDGMICAALLHDVIEDCPHVDPQQIADDCGPAVLQLVRELTNPSHGQPGPRGQRKKQDRDHLRTVSRQAQVIKLIDRICNVRDMARDCEQVPEQFLKLYAAESRLLADAIGNADLKLATELLAAVEALERRAKH